MKPLSFVRFSHFLPLAENAGEQSALSRASVLERHRRAEDLCRLRTCHARAHLVSGKTPTLDHADGLQIRHRLCAPGVVRVLHVVVREVHVRHAKQPVQHDRGLIERNGVIRAKGNALRRADAGHNARVQRAHGVALRPGRDLRVVTEARHREVARRNARAGKRHGDDLAAADGAVRLKEAPAADLRADDGRPIPSDSIGASGFCNAHGLGACIRRLGARPLSRPRSVLFIGNSYTYYNLVPGIVRELASFEGRDLRVEMFTIGGCTMERHLEQADCRDLIERGGYDFVVLQDQSLHPALIGTPDDQGIAGHMEAIVAHIRTHNPKVSPYIEMTWGRRDGYTERKFDYDFLRSYASMQERIRVNPLAEAEAVGAGCIPVGVAWSRVRTERPDIELYAADGSHPSYAGSYLAAAVICTTLTGAPFGATPSDGLLDPDTAAYLRRVAEQTVLGGE